MEARKREGIARLKMRALRRTEFIVLKLTFFGLCPLQHKLYCAGP